MSTSAETPRPTAPSPQPPPPALSPERPLELTSDQAELLAGALAEMLALTQNALARAQVGLPPDAGAVATGFLIAPRALAAALGVLLPAPDSPASLALLEHRGPILAPDASVLSALAGANEEMDPDLLSAEVEAALANLSARVAHLAPPEED